MFGMGTGVAPPGLLPEAHFKVLNNNINYKKKQQQKNGGGERDRTDDPLLAKQVLSQLSYTPEYLSNKF